MAASAGVGGWLPGLQVWEANPISSCQRLCRLPPPTTPKGSISLGPHILLTRTLSQARQAKLGPTYLCFALSLSPQGLKQVVNVHTSKQEEEADREGGRDGTDTRDPLMTIFLGCQRCTLGCVSKTLICRAGTALVRVSFTHTLSHLGPSTGCMTASKLTKGQPKTPPQQRSGD